MEEKYTLSAVIRKIIEIEEKTAEFYEKASEEIKEERIRKIFSKFSKKNKERIKTLEKTGRETVLELALEPIVGLKLKDYLKQIENIISSEEKSYIEKAIMLEEKLNDIYKETSNKIAYSSADASILVGNFATESIKRKKMLSELTS